MSTFVELQNDVIEGHLKEAQRDKVKKAINSRYGIVWALHDWTFRHGSAAATVTNGSSTLTTSATDVGPVRGVLDQDGRPIVRVEEKDFENLYHDDHTITGRPTHYTVVSGPPSPVLKVGPQPEETRTDWVLLYDKAFSKLTNDTDVPLLPEEFHESILVNGPRGEMLTDEQDPTADTFEALYTTAIQAMEREYLAPVMGEHVQWGRDVR